MPQIQSTSLAAERGTAIHAFLAACQRDREQALKQIPPDKFEWREVCEAVDIESLPTALAAEVSYAVNATTGECIVLGQMLNRNYPDLPPEWIFGTADTVGSTSNHGFVGDWFTGRGPMDKADQLDFLAFALSKVENCTEVETAAIRIRDDGSHWFERRVLDEIDLAAIALRLKTLVSRIEAARTEPLAHLVEGEHCQFCPAKLSCPAKVTLLRGLHDGSAIAALENMIPLDKHTLGEVWERLHACKTLLNRIERACYAAFGSLGEAVTGNAIYRQVIEPGNERIDCEKAMNAISHAVPNGIELALACTQPTMTKKSLGEGVRKFYSKKDAARVERELLAAMRSAEAIQRPLVQKIVKVEGDG